ncbi:MAG: 50S ribosomal protein L25 [Candidatus Omnitrophica bacterium]|nr:50S ribosomal protein L25 [Candidatus Omnitrophota bacterium]
MEEIKLDVQIRNEIGRRKLNAVRGEDCVPAIVYGGDSGPTPIKVDRRVFEKIIRQHKGQNVVFHLNVHEGDKKLRDYSVILKDEQFDPVSEQLLHIDFNRISLNKEVEVYVQIVPVGEAVGVKQDGGSVDIPLKELDVVCLPTNIPEQISIDVTDLHIGDGIHVKDIQLPDGVITKHDPEALVVSVVPPMKEEVAEEEGDGQEPEVIKAKKEKPEADKEQDNKDVS